MKNFHDKLSYLMDEVFDISGNALAKELGWSGGAIYKYKKGESIPSLTFVVKLCNYFGISANWLLLNIEPMMLSEIPGTVNKDETRRDVYKQRLMEHDINALLSAVNEFKEKYGKR